MPKFTITLEVDLKDGPALDSDSVGQIFRDAFGEFVKTRTPVEPYVEDRYPRGYSGTFITDKCREVVKRIEWARALSVAGSFAKVEPEPEVEMVECPGCRRPEDAVNHVPGHVFVGWGSGWDTCPECHGTTKVPKGS